MGEITTFTFTRALFSLSCFFLVICLQKYTTEAAEGDGTSLLEVFSVTINNIDGENPGDLYGRIYIEDDGDFTAHDIYNRDEKNYEVIRPKENALLTGPKAKSLRAGRFGFIIKLDLKDRDGALDFDDEISKGFINWSFINADNVYETPISREVPGKHGSVNVTYMVMQDAVQATVVVDVKPQVTGKIYGVIAATNSNFTNESVLFKDTINNVDSLGLNNITMSRSIVSVSLSSSLRVRANLLTESSLEPNSVLEFANGTADFPAATSGTSEKTISGKHGEITVKVTWALVV